LTDRSGARTGLASLTSGVTVLLTLLFLAPLFSNLPKAVLGALIIEAVVMGMMDFPEMRRMFRVKKVDFWIAVVALLGTLVFGVLAGVIIGIGMSLVWLVAVATHPQMPTLGRERGTQVFRDVDSFPDDEIVPGVAVVRFDGGLFFATADALEDHLREVIQANPELTGIVIDCGGVNFIDSQGAAKMADVVTLARDAGVNLRLTRLKPAPRAVLERDGVIEQLGSDKIHGNIYRAVEAEQADAERRRDDDAEHT
jgi:anti-anti-sigma factor